MEIVSYGFYLVRFDVSKLQNKNTKDLTSFPSRNMHNFKTIVKMVIKREKTDINNLN